MYNLITKHRLLLALCSLATPYPLLPAKSVGQTFREVSNHTLALSDSKCQLLGDGYCNSYSRIYIPKEITCLISCFVYDNPLQYSNKSLPEDLSEQDLRGFDFTGCHFMGTDLTNTNLDHAILENTTCRYKKAFQNNIQRNWCEGGEWYKDNLVKDIRSIAKYYSILKTNAEKAKLLHIACGFSRLPFYEGSDFYTKLTYWSCELLSFKRERWEQGSWRLTCSIDLNIDWHVTDSCWKTQYPKGQVKKILEEPPADFERYLKEFESGLVTYQCKAKNNIAFEWYKKSIALTILDLQEAYPKIKIKQLQQEACRIAYALSKSYQFQKMRLLHYLLFYQNRFIWLKNSTRINVKSKVDFSFLKEKMPCWRRRL